MDSPLIGSDKLIEVNTAQANIVIKSKSRASVANKFSSDDKISTVRISGFDISNISICGSEVFTGNGLFGMQHNSFVTCPLFFEQCDYEIIVEGKRESAVQVWHENRNIREKISPVTDDHLISGVINFGNSVGFSDFDILVDGRKAVSVCVEVYPTKITYKDDYQRMISEISDEVYKVALDFLKKTYQGMNPASDSTSTPAEFFRIISAIFSDFQNAANKIISLPNHKLEVEHVVQPYYKAKRVDNSSVKWLNKHGEYVTEANGKFTVEKILAVRKHITHNTSENQFTKFILQRTVKRLSEFKERYKKEENSDSEVLNSVDKMMSSVFRLLNGTFLKNVDDYKATQSMSLVFGMAPGYRELFRYYLMLQRGLNINGDVFKISMKDTAILYEYWCFIRLVRMLKDQKYELASPDVIRVDNSGITVTLVKGKRSEIKFVNPRSGEHITLAYNPSEYNTQTVPQKPDNVLTLEKSGSEIPYKYVFDAKYRIENHPDDHYPDTKPGPKLDDINTMHRYRDSIVYENTLPSKFQFEKTMFGAYVLFPYGGKDKDGNDLEKQYKKHRFYKSISSVNIGGLPFLPGSTSLVESFISELIADSDESAFERASLPRGIESKLASVDWNNRDVLIGSVRSQEQYDWCKKNRIYYVPAPQFSENNLPVHYVGIYGSKRSDDPGIRWYGKVVKSYQTKRKMINQLKTHTNPDAIYYVFVVKEWSQLSNPIHYDYEAVHAPKMTNKFLLENCTKSYELFNIHNEEQYRLLNELKRAFSDTTVSDKENEPLYRINQDYSLWSHNGYFNLIVEDGNIIGRFDIKAFSAQPGRVFNEILRKTGQ